MRKMLSALGRWKTLIRVTNQSLISRTYAENISLSICQWRQQNLARNLASFTVSLFAAMNSDGSWKLTSVLITIGTTSNDQKRLCMTMQNLELSDTDNCYSRLLVEIYDYWQLFMNIHGHLLWFMIFLHWSRFPPVKRFSLLFCILNFRFTIDR